uniref:SHSP domain-containing protein n=1 Tax=Arundo donax TaxID=35708 RepID=A0A0A9GUG4_ARUDO
MASKQGTKQQHQQQAADHEFEPKYEWQENAANFVLRLHLSGFRKEDFKVQVDGAGRLTVRGQRADAGKHARFHKVFQLPATSNLDDISGRFDAGVLTLTVPKRPAAPPATIEEIKKPRQQVDDAKPKLVDQAKPEEDTKRPQPDEGKPKEEIKKPKDDAKLKEQAMTKKAEQVKEEMDANRSKPEQEEHKTAPPAVKKEEDKPKPEGAAAAPTEKKQVDDERAATAVDRERAATEKKLERMRRRCAEEERAKAAAAAEEAERERTAARRGWKERVAEELEGLAGSEWAEGLVETVKKNKEVIAAAVAAFSIGFLASRLFSRN